MKKVLLSLAVGTAAVLGFATTAEAGGGYGHSYGGGYGYSTGHSRGGYTSGHRNINSYTGHAFSSHQHCATPYVVRTCEVNRQTVCQRVYDSCGRLRMHHITVVTYQAHYSDGSCRTFTRTFS